MFFLNIIFYKCNIVLILIILFNLKKLFYLKNYFIYLFKKLFYLFIKKIIYYLKNHFIKKIYMF